MDGPSTFGVKGTCCRCLYWGVDPLAVKGGLWTTIIELTIKGRRGDGAVIAIIRRTEDDPGVE